MRRVNTLGHQKGATLFVGLMMLVLITLMLITAFTLSTTNVRIVGNMQFREEAIAAANAAIEERLGATSSTTSASALISQTSHTIDINNDGAVDYSVAVTPTCLSAKLDSAVPFSSLSLPAELSEEGTWDSTWNVRAIVTDTRTNASVEMHTGIILQLRDAVKKTTCD